MKVCKFCGTPMHSEFETNSQDSHRRKGFHHCPNCTAVCDDDITKKGNSVVVHYERWFNPQTKEFE